MCPVRLSSRQTIGSVGTAFQSHKSIGPMPYWYCFYGVALRRCAVLGGAVAPRGVPSTRLALPGAVSTTTPSPGVSVLPHRGLVQRPRRLGAQRHAPRRSILARPTSGGFRRGPASLPLLNGSGACTPGVPPALTCRRTRPARPNQEGCAVIRLPANRARLPDAPSAPPDPSAPPPGPRPATAGPSPGSRHSFSAIGPDSPCCTP